MTIIYRTAQEVFVCSEAAADALSFTMSLEAMPQPYDLAHVTVGLFLRAGRLAMRLSFRDLAKLTGISASQIQRIEKGEGDFPLGSFFRLCRAVGLPAGAVLDSATWSHLKLDEGKCPADPDFAAAVDRAGGTPQKRAQNLKKLRHYAALALPTIATSLAVSNPSFSRSPAVALQEKLQSLAVQFHDYGNVERLAALKSLMEDPWNKLRSLGMFERRILDEIVAMTTVMVPAPLLSSRAIIRTLIAAGEGAHIPLTPG